MDYHRRSGADGPIGLKVNASEIVDIYDGKAWKDSMDDSFLLEPRHLRIGIVTDGVQVFRDNDQYSIWPIAITAYNLPPTKRYLIGPTSILGILPGKNDRDIKMNIQPFIQLIADELKFLNNEGWKVHDAHRGDDFVCKVRLIHVVSDLRGLEKVFDQPPVPSKYACMKCFVQGVRIPQGKTIYPGIARCLSDQSPLRNILLKKPLLEHMYVSPIAASFPLKTKFDYLARANEVPTNLIEQEGKSFTDNRPSFTEAPTKRVCQRDNMELVSNINDAGPSSSTVECGTGERLTRSGKSRMQASSTIDILPVPAVIGEEDDIQQPCDSDSSGDNSDEEVMYADEDANQGKPLNVSLLFTDFCFKPFLYRAGVINGSLSVRSVGTSLCRG